MPVPALLTELNEHLIAVQERLAALQDGDVMAESWLGRYRLETVRDKITEQADLVQQLYQAIDGGLTNKTTVLDALATTEGHLRAGAADI